MRYKLSTLTTNQMKLVQRLCTLVLVLVILRVTQLDLVLIYLFLRYLFISMVILVNIIAVIYCCYKAYRVGEFKEIREWLRTKLKISTEGGKT